MEKQYFWVLNVFKRVVVLQNFVQKLQTEYKIREKKRS